MVAAEGAAVEEDRDAEVEEDEDAEEAEPHPARSLTGTIDMT